MEDVCAVSAVSNAVVVLHGVRERVPAAARLVQKLVYAQSRFFVNENGISN